MKRTSNSGISQARVRRIRREANRNVDVLNLSVCEDRQDIHNSFESDDQEAYVLNNVPVVEIESFDHADGNDVAHGVAKRNIEFLKFHLKDISAKLDDLLNSRPKPCICTIQRIEENEDQFQLPMDSFDHIENMENTLRDNFTRQQMVYRLRGVNIICLNHTRFVSRFLRCSELGE